MFRNRRHFCTPARKYQKQKSGKKIPFAITTRKMEYLWMNLTKEVKDLYSENYTTLKKKIKEDKKQMEACTTVSYTHLTLPTTIGWCRSRWSPYH